MLTTHDINTLMDGLDALEINSTKDQLMKLMLTAGLTEGKHREQALSRLKEEHKTQKEKEKILRENIILIKAKLIALRDKAEAKEFADSVGDS